MIHSMESKRCGNCKLVKSLDEFHKSAARGTQNHCKSCKAELKLAWVRQNPEKVRNNHLWSRYRLRPGDFETLLESQGYACALCEEPFEDAVPHIDHDHSCCSGVRSCGECVRGLLCGTCNKALGQLESLDLEKAFAYIGRAGTMLQKPIR